MYQPTYIAFKLPTEKRGYTFETLCASLFLSGLVALEMLRFKSLPTVSQLRFKFGLLFSKMRYFRVRIFW